MSSKLERPSHTNRMTYKGTPVINQVNTSLVSWAQQHHLSTALLLAGLLVAGLVLVQFASPNLAGTDGYYHIKFAALMRQEGLRPAFPYLPLSILNPREFYDHHFLFHIALIPFTFGDLRSGAKLASVLFAGLAFMMFWWLLQRRRVPYAALWAIALLAISEAFLYRMSMVRVQSLSLALLVLGLYFAIERKHIYLLPLGFIYVWLYDAFPLLLVVAGAYSAAAWLTEGRLEVKPVLYAGAGVLLGLAVNPYFPYNILFAVQHILPKLGEATAVRVGSEWYPYKTSQLLENSPLTLFAFISGVFALGLRGRRMDIETAASLILAVLFGIMTFQSRRFIEYFPPFTLLFCAFAWAPMLAARKAEGKDTITLPRTNHTGRMLAWLHSRIPLVLMLSVLAAGLFVTLPAAREGLLSSKPYQRYQQAATWLGVNTPSGARIFQTDWDDFPRLFYYNTHNTYLVGLDPTYMQLYDASLYDLWVEITAGNVESPSREIYGRFGAEYVFSDLNHKGFIKAADSDPGLVELYRDEEAIIYHVTH